MTIRSALLEKVPGILHGFGTKQEAAPAEAITSKQVHGVAILEVDERPTESLEGYDILLTGRPGLIVAVKTADCLPVLMADPERRIIAAVHAGWKGTAGRVVQKAIERLTILGARPERLVAALGPNMGHRCYEVQNDVASIFEKEFPGWPVLKPKSEERWWLDVAEANRRQLLESGVRSENIDRIDLCTHCRPDLFHSHRRDAAGAGRMINFIMLLIS